MRPPGRGDEGAASPPGGVAPGAFVPGGEPRSYRPPDPYPVRPVLTPRQAAPRTVPPARRRPGTAPAYWSSNVWCAVRPPSLPLTAADGGGPTLTTPSPTPSPRPRAAPPGRGAPKKGAGKAPAKVLLEVANLEVLQRATLGALASFNQNEKMILQRRFMDVELLARQQGLYSPEGLVDVPQFRAVWKSLSVPVSAAQARAVFQKYGEDSQGLLPYNLYVQRLLESPSRQLGLEGVQKGPYRAGGKADFTGKIVYRPCRTGVFPPSNWEPEEARYSAKKPRAGLKLEFIYGYAGIRATAANLFYTAEGKAVYYTAGIGIVYSMAGHTQQFFKGHDDDISCLAIHPDRQLVASGQVAGIGETGNCPYVCVWDTRAAGQTLKQVQRIDFPGDGELSYRMIAAVGFSACGARLAVVTGDNKHTIFIFEWRTKRCVFQGVGQNGTPPQVFGVVWNPFLREGKAAVKMFVTRGVKHLKFWSLAVARNGTEVYSPTIAKFAPKASVADVLSAEFIDADTLLTGTEMGEILTWDVTGKRSGKPGTCIAVLKAHGPGKPFVDREGKRRYHGVRCLKLRFNGTELLSGGADGTLIRWDCSGGRLGSPIGTQRIQTPGEKFTAFRAIDSHPGSNQYMAGTSHCDIWEVDNDPSVLIYGHVADLYGCAFHPNQPHKFATVCESSNVFVWNAKKRQLLSKVSVKAKARMACISPNGLHLAVGCAGGRMRVLMFDDLKRTVADKWDHKEAIDEMAYSPDGSRLVTGSHDNFMNLYDAQSPDYALVARCVGHSSYITHIDWSADSRCFQSTCGAYELLYWHGRSGKQIISDQRNQAWDTYTSTLGFSVMGIWQDGSDGTDINALDRSHRQVRFAGEDPLAGEHPVVVTSGDDGAVRLFNYPCVVEDAPNRKYIGHSSHVMMARFAPHNRWVITTGGKDRAIFQWRVDREGRDQEGTPSRRAEQENYVYEPPKRRLVEDLPSGLGLLPGVAAAAGALPAAAGRADRRDLALGGAGAECEYEITVITSDLRGAGTDANVFVVLYGARGNTAELRLDNKRENFERGRRDEFRLRAADVGAVEKVRIGHDNCGASSGWHLDKVVVQNRTASDAAPVVFPCDLWLAKDEDDGQLVRMLTPDGPVEGPGGRAPKVKYRVTVITSDRRGAGTDANVHITLFGAAGDSGPRRLENSKNNFERGATDTFEVEAAIGPIERLRIGHDNSGLGPAWHLDQVTLQAPGEPAMVFDSDQWFATDEGDRQTERTLFPIGKGGKPRGALCTYKIQVLTSDVRGAGTDANVHIILFGERTNSGKRVLETARNNFERGQVRRLVGAIAFALPPPLPLPLGLVRTGANVVGPDARDRAPAPSPIGPLPPGNAD